ncbi:GGDEF domain-containing protein [Streptomyces sp. NBC_00201]|uniref:GGDEF domain-containing protein n=1 Tax=unclassified Streptomyces TaxID=2593676 RepID=UPI00225A383C|nr:MULTISPECIES: GGDEF domain-containing protein [unclassified Streptomyces]MCX5058614.1 GGDEF domain-containing protein [Streptomyces sp. NBC_00452]MCX5244506.1 GGDEF domain-containing protein [Streptomyces sp. NBC_00201]MCX5289762.1 GGDEF domain-containing protein [Streptomyces sp. NBC_00183]
MRSWTDTLRFAFQPVVNLTTGGVAGLEILARPEAGDILAEARRDPELDGRLAVLAVRAAARKETLLPLHVNVFAGTLADLGGLTPLHDAVRAAGRLPWEVTIDIGPPYTHVPHQALLEAVGALRAQGFRISADGVGDGDVPLRLLTDMGPDLVKLDASLLARPAAVMAMRTLCEQLGALLSVEGVETELQCGAAISAGAQLAQGELFAPPARLPAADVYVPPRSPGAVTVPRSGPSVRQFVRPAALLPATASAGQVRALLTGSPEVSGVLLVDQHGLPVRSVHRSRFLLSMSGRYGHALYADRPAVKLGDHPRTVGVDATAWEVLDVVAVGDRSRTSDDVAVVDRHGRCVGVVRLADLVRALAESRVEEAAGLNPLTRLPGSDAITGEVDRRIADGRTFALSWLDVDHFKQVNDGAGFAAGDELIRSVGRALQHAASGSTRVGHIGGDDFLVLAEPEWLDPLAASVLDAPWSAGGRPVTLSLATVLCPPGSVLDHRQAAACLAPLKKAAKSLQGASWVLGRAGLAGHEIRRGSGAAPAQAGCAVAEPGLG